MHSGASGDRLQCASRVLQRALHGGPLAVYTARPDRVTIARGRPRGVASCSEQCQGAGGYPLKQGLKRMIHLKGGYI